MIERAMMTLLREQMLGPAGLAYEQARRAGIRPGQPFTRTVDQHTGKVTITPRRRTNTERLSVYRRLSRSMSREERYEAMRRRMKR